MFIWFVVFFLWYFVDTIGNDNEDEEENWEF